ncbi:MAG: hypothetical protein ACRCYY_14940 [Trueperaceae bacterium]
MLIRNASSKDFPGIAGVLSSVWPDDRTTKEALEYKYPMLAINEVLGFVKQPTWIEFVKTFKEES